MLRGSIAAQQTAQNHPNLHCSIAQEHNNLNWMLFPKARAKSLNLNQRKKTITVTQQKRCAALEQLSHLTEVSLQTRKRQGQRPQDSPDTCRAASQQRRGPMPTSGLQAAPGGSAEGQHGRAGPGRGGSCSRPLRCRRFAEATANEPGLSLLCRQLCQTSPSPTGLVGIAQRLLRARF